VSGGITVRWDKNFLTLLHLTLARRRGLRMYGGVRFGGRCRLKTRGPTASTTSRSRPAPAGRHHRQKNNLIRGSGRRAILMALQLTGAFKRDALPTCRRGSRPSSSAAG
jgi:hypothetical protein